MAAQNTTSKRMLIGGVLLPFMAAVIVLTSVAGAQLVKLNANSQPLGQGVISGPATTLNGGIVTDGKLTVTQLPEPQAFAAEAIAYMVDSHTANFLLGGSSSCPPNVRAITQDGDTIKLMVATGTDADMACTMDYTMSEFQITSDTPLQASSIEVIYNNFPDSFSIPIASSYDAVASHSNQGLGSDLYASQDGSSTASAVLSADGKALSIVYDLSLTCGDDLVLTEASETQITYTLAGNATVVDCAFEQAKKGSIELSSVTPITAENVVFVLQDQTIAFPVESAQAE